MEIKSKTSVAKNFAEKSILISREFDASVESVWRAFTESEILDKWWAPQPWRTETKTMDFRAGGYWLYAMVGPQNEKHWGRMNYTAIEPLQSFHIEDAFCDADGNPNPELPVSKGSMEFTKTGTGTLVKFKMFYSSEKELQTIVEMGFEQGITATLESLAELLRENKF